MPSRRDYLAAGTSVFAALAGCTESVGRPNPERSPTRTTTTDPITIPKLLPWGESATVQGTDVTPQAVTVQDCAFYLATPDTLDVLSFGNQQAVFVTVDVEGDLRPAPADFALTFEDAVPGWVTYEDVRGSRFRGHGQVYDSDEDGTGWIGFNAPKPVAIDDPRLRVQFGREENGAVRWSLPDDAAAALQSPPEFACAEFSAPESVPQDDPIEVSVRVTNDGAGAGTFRAAFNQLGPTYQFERVEIDLDADESREWMGTIASHVGSQEVDQVSFAFRSPCGTFERTVDVTDT